MTDPMGAVPNRGPERRGEGTSVCSPPPPARGRIGLFRPCSRTNDQTGGRDGTTTRPKQRVPTKNAARHRAAAEWIARAFGRTGWSYRLRSETDALRDERDRAGHSRRTLSIQLDTLDSTLSVPPSAPEAGVLLSLPTLSGGGGIRTPGTQKGTPVFETGAFSQAPPPHRFYSLTSGCI